MKKFPHAHPLPNATFVGRNIARIFRHFIKYFNKKPGLRNKSSPIILPLDSRNLQTAGFAYCFLITVKSPQTFDQSDIVTLRDICCALSPFCFSKRLFWLG